MKAITWEDGKKSSAIEFVSTGDGNKDLDIAAKMMGFIDYADMAQDRSWADGEGLNIEWEAGSSDPDSE